MGKKYFFLLSIFTFSFLVVQAQGLESDERKLAILKFLIPIAIIVAILRFVKARSENPQSSIEDITTVRIDENLKKITDLYEKSKTLTQEEYENGINEILNSMINSINNLNEYDKVSNTMEGIQKLNILSEEELLIRNNELSIIKKKLLIEDTINRKTKPLIDELFLSKTKGLFNTDIEFEEKKTAILEKVRTEVEHDFKTKPKLSDIDSSIRQKLSETKLSKLERFLSIVERGELIVLQNNKLKILNTDQWNQIISDNKSSEIELIFKRN